MCKRLIFGINVQSLKRQKVFYFGAKVVKKHRMTSEKRKYRILEGRKYRIPEGRKIRTALARQSRRGRRR